MTSGHEKLDPRSLTLRDNSDSSSLPNPRPCPSPCDIDGGDGDQGPELYELLEHHARGDLTPSTVVLGPLPRDASPAMVAVADEIRLLIGLRRSVDDYRALPASARFIASRAGTSARHANRILELFCAVGTLVDCGAMPGRAGRRGTRLYAAPDLLARDAPVGVASPDDIEPLEAVEFGEEAVGLEFPVEGRDLLAVDRAEAVVPPARAVGMVASAEGAGSTVHVTDGNPEDGGIGGPQP